MTNNKIEISEYDSLLVYKNGYTPEFAQGVINENKLSGLRIWTDPMENPPESLSFLVQFEFLKALDVTSLHNYDFNFLERLTNLKKLSINTEGNNEIDLSNQTNLEYLVIQWRKGKIKGLEHCQRLQTLALIEYKEQDFLPISTLHHLRHLRVKTASVKTLDGLANLPLLEDIFLGYCRHLRSIEAINGRKYLRSVVIDLCGKIEDFDSLSDLPQMEELSLIDCKDIRSISFVRNFPLLRMLRLTGNTNVVDGDLTPTLRIKEVYYPDRKHYNLKARQ